MANTDLLLSSPTAGDRQKGTISVWVKRTAVSANGYLYSTWNTSQGGYSSGLLQFASTDELVLTNYQANGGSHTELKTNRKFRDINCWYHICVNWDTTLATSSDRFKMFINGVRETSFATATYPSQNENLFFDIGGANNPIRIGSVQGTSAYLDAVLSHYHKVDGTAYAASTFGSTDATTGEWKINTNPSLTYGSGSGNFFVFKDGTNLSGSTVQDQSGEGNDLTVDGGTLTKTEDCPNNVFATLNPLVRHQGTLDLGNTRFGTTGSWRGIPATMGVSTGKYYWEFKQVVQTNWSQNGIMSAKPNGGYDAIYATYVGNNSGGLALNSGGGDFYHDGSSGAYSTSAWFSGGLSAGDIIGVALDATNSKIWFAKNGTWGNSSNPATGTNGIDFSGDTDFTSYKPYFPACSIDQCECAYNFGNGYFGTTAVSSAGTNASNLGIFEYDVPSGFTALCTKGLNE